MRIPPFIPRAAATILGIAALTANAASLTTGNLVISRTGDGTSAIGSAASQVTLVEVQTNGTPTGNLVMMPTQASANSGGLTDSGSASSNGQLNRSADGRYLVLAGYDAALGTAGVTGLTAAVANRNVARVDGAGTVNIVARLTDAYSANNVRSAASDTGSSFYLTGNPGVRWADASSLVPTTSTPIVASGSVRDGILAQDATGAKFLVTNSGTVLSYFSGFPTSAATGTSLGITLTDAYAFVLLDRSPAVGATGLGGLDTLYVADGSGTGGSATAVLRKFEWSGSAWVAAGTATMSAAQSKLFGLTARAASNGSVELYATTAINSNNSLVTITDASNSNAFGGSLSGTLTVLATAGVNYAFRGVAFAPQTDVSISAASPAAAFTAAPFDITLTAINGGLANAQNVGVQFTLPAGLSFVSASGAGFTASQASGVVTFSGGTINASSSVPLTITVTAASAGSYAIPAGAAVIDPLGAVEESNELNNASASATGPSVTDAADLTVSVSAPPKALTGPAGFDYTISAQNISLAEATGVTVQFTVPSGLTYVSATGSGFTVDETGGVVSFTGGSISAGGSAALTVHVTAAADATISTPVGAAVIDPGHLIAEVSEANNSSAAIADITVATSDLVISNLHNGTFQAGDPAATYTLTVSNAGTGATQGLVTVTDTLPAGLVATSFAGTGWTIGQGTGGMVTATRSDALAAGESYPALTLMVSIALNTQTSVTNAASVAGGGEANTTNNTADDNTPVVGAGPGVIQFTETHYEVNEEAGTISIPLTRTGGRTGLVKVTVTSFNDRAKAPDDFAAVEQVVEFADNGVSGQVTVAVVPDHVTEINEPFTLKLSDPQGGAALGTRKQVSVLILEPDNTKPVVSIRVPAAHARINEGSVEVLGRDYDKVGIRDTEVSLNGGAFAPVARFLLPEYTGPDTYQRTITPTPGLNTVVARSTDYRGNFSEATCAFTYVVKRPLTLTTLPSVAAGTVTLTPNEALTALELAQSYTLNAVAKPGFVWDHWTTPADDVESPSLTFTMSQGLAVTAHFVADPFVSQVVGEFNGLVTATGITRPRNHTNGFIHLKVGASGGFTGSLKIDGVTLPLAGVLDNTGHARFGTARSLSGVLPRTNKPGLVLAFAADLSLGGTHKLTGTLDEQTPDGTSAMSIVDADRAAFDGRTPATSTAAATYTVALPPASTDWNYPQGDGIGSITVAKNGLVTLNATLADGTVVLASAPLSAARKTPLFAQLYANNGGSFGAWIALDETAADTDLTSISTWWFRPFMSGPRYLFGWPRGLAPPLIGAKYAVPAGSSVLRDLDTVPSPNATLTFSGGGLASDIIKPVHVDKTNTVTRVPATDASFTMALTAATGKFSGTFTRSDGTRPAFAGVILQKGANRRGFGQFMGSTLAGAARLNYTIVPHPTLVISELMAKNVSTIQDEDGAYSDWIEIYNPGSTAVDLTNWCLTDNDTNLSKWRFPAVTLAGKQFLLVWASSKNRRTPGLPLHTNFSLSNDGEYLALVRPDGVTIEQEFAPTFPALGDDESYGVNFVGAAYAVQGSTARYLVPKNATLGSTWTAPGFSDSGWRSGKTGLGFGVTVPGLTVRQVAAASAFGAVQNVAQADALLALPAGDARIASEATAIAPMLNLLGDGSDGHYDNNLTLPNGTAEPYALKATGFIAIPTAGKYVFGLNSDDGGRIKIDGVAVMVDDSNHGPEDHLSTPVTLTAGSHAVEVMMWEGGGGDEVELYAAPGTATTWDDSFKLVGGTGGLAVFTPPPGNTSATGNDVATNVKSLMLNINASCYVRLPFNASEVSTLSALTLKMRYNDGFVAWLNGTEVARRNAPAMLAFDSAATSTRSVTDSLEEESIDLTSHLNLLVNGKNVLAIQAMNDSAVDGSFLVLPELVATGVLRSATAVRFSPVAGGLTATPGAINGIPSAQLAVADTSFSAHRGFFTAPFTTAIATATPGAQIRYTVDGSTPTATHGALYTAPLKISRTTVLRAAAFKTGYEPTNVDTQSYFFIADVLAQQANGKAPGAGWEPPAADGSTAVNGQVINYGMDARIVNSTDSTIGGTAKMKEALAAIPTISLVTDLPNLFDAAAGIYVNPYNRGFDWERPCSVEYLNDAGTPAGGFQINCGMRMRGGFSRSTDNPKHSFHLFFRSQYGDAKLKYPVFGAGGTSSFEQIDMRTAQNYSWSFGGDGSNTFVREETSRELQGAMGQPYSRDGYFHLYINGVYWGIYDFDERTEASFASTYLGGSKSDYDVVKAEQDSGYVTGVTDGNLDAWQALWNKALAHATDPSNTNYFAMQGKAADGVSPSSDPVLLDPDNLIDYMLLTFWTGNLDGCTSAFLGEEKANNWFGARDRTGSSGFRFFAHDFEHTFLNVGEDRTGPFDVGAKDKDFTNSNPMWIHHDLRGNAEYRMRWADRVQKHMFNGGALVAENIEARVKRRISQLDAPIIAESARWGDSKRETPLTRLDWKEAARYVTDNYLPARGSVVLAQLRADGLYPSFDAPVLNQFGGKIATGSEIVISGAGTLYYTLDGADPRQVGGSVNPAAQVYTSATSAETLLPLNQTWKYLGDGSDQGTAWRSAAFDDSAWAGGPAELGYGDGDEATVVPFVTTGGAKNATTYFRSTFTASNVSEITAASISLRYDDAAIIYINGVEAVRTGNIASNPAFNQYASGGAPDENAFFSFTVDPALLVNGTNTIAAEVHQFDGNSSDISFSMSLSATRTATATPLFLANAGKRHLQVRALNSGEWSALVDATFDVSALPDLRISNTANGSFNTGDTGKTFTLTVSNQGNAATTGLITVTDALPVGLTATSLSGAGWVIVQGSGSNVTATRTDALAIGASCPPLTLTVDVAVSAPASVTTVATASGGGEVNTGNSSAITATPVTPTGAGLLSFAASTYDVNEEAGPVVVTILRSGSRAGEASVKLNSTNGTARAGADFDEQKDVTVTFADGQASATVAINIASDSVAEPNESFTLKLSNASGTATLGSPASTQVRIIEQDNTLPVAAISSPAANAVVTAGGVVITGAVTDNKGVARVQVSVNGGAWFDVPATLAANGLSATYAAPVGVATGINTVAVRAYDTRGNVSPAVSRSFTFVPLRPLAISVLPPGSGMVAITPTTALTKLKVGTGYTLKPTAKNGFLFDHWVTPGGSVETPSLGFTMSEGLGITAVFTANPFVPVVTGDYNGLASAAVGVTSLNSSNGFLQIKVTGTGAFSGTLKMDGDTLPLAGSFKNAGTVSLALARMNKPSLLLNLALDLNPAGTHKMTGTIGVQLSDGPSPLAAVEAERGYFDGHAHLAAKASYKVQVPALPASPARPVGAGGGMLSVATNGVVTLVLKLADGTSFMTTALLSEGMRAPLFAQLYTTKQGCFLAPAILALPLPGDGVLCGSALWFRPYLSGTPFAFGWPEGVAVSLVRVP